MTTDHTRDVIVIGSNPFEAGVPLGDWQLARAFARQGARVLYINPVRSALTYGVNRISTSARLGPDNHGEVRVFTPLGLYGRLRGSPARAQERWVVSQVRSAAAKLGMVEPLVLTVRPERGVWSGLSRGPLVYWQKDSEWTAPNVPDAEWTYRSYLRLLRAADLVVTVSSHLCKLARDNGVAAVVVPNGCDLSSPESDLPEPAALNGLPRPRAAYAGSFSDRVDHELFGRLVRTFPDVSFVVIGLADAPHPDATNVHFLGQLGFQDLRAHLRHADVGLVPYLPSAFNAASRPLKIYDYLAAGLPVLTTGVDTDGLDERVVRSSADHDSALSTFARLIDDSATLRAAALDEARRNTWDARVTTLTALAYH